MSSLEWSLGSGSLPVGGGGHFLERQLAGDKCGKYSENRLRELWRDLASRWRGARGIAWGEDQLKKRKKKRGLTEELRRMRRKLGEWPRKWGEVVETIRRSFLRETIRRSFLREMLSWTLDEEEGGNWVGVEKEWTRTERELQSFGKKLGEPEELEEEKL